MASTTPTAEAAVKAGADPKASAVGPTGFWVVVSSCNEAGIKRTAIPDNPKKWFDDTMDRLSGSYKRFVQGFLVVLAILVTVGFNMSTIHVLNTFGLNLHCSLV